jgi:hypothetical protein
MLHSQRPHTRVLCAACSYSCFWQQAQPHTQPSTFLGHSLLRSAPVVECELVCLHHTGIYFTSKEVTALCKVSGCNNSCLYTADTPPVIITRNPLVKNSLWPKSVRLLLMWGQVCNMAYICGITCAKLFLALEHQQLCHPHTLSLRGFKSKLKTCSWPTQWVLHAQTYQVGGVLGWWCSFPHWPFQKYGLL